MKVQATPGLNVPKEDKPHDYITDAELVEVPDTAYYQRRIMDGDLVVMPDTAQAAPVDVVAKTATKGVA